MIIVNMVPPGILLNSIRNKVTNNLSASYA
jgi:hypothetical protein